MVLLKELLRSFNSSFYLKQEYFVLRRTLCDTPLAVDIRKDAVLIEMVKDDIWLIENMLSPKHLEFIKLRFDLGERCLGLKCGGRIVAWCFWSDESQTALPGLYETRQGEVVSAEVFTREECRGNGFMTTLSWLRDRYLLGRGYHSMVMIILKDNKAMLRINKKLNSMVIGEFTYMRIFRVPHRSLHMYQQDCPIG